MMQGLFSDLFRGGKQSVSPEDVIEAALAAAKEQARRWGEGNKEEVPNRFDVAINPKDWREYFSNHTEQTQARIADLLYEKITAGNYSMEGRPQVRLYRDGDIDATWLTVRASFAEVEDRSGEAGAGRSERGRGQGGMRDVGALNKTIPFSDGGASQGGASDSEDGGAVGGASKTVPLSDGSSPIDGMSPSEYADALDALVPKTIPMPDGNSGVYLRGVEGKYPVSTGYRVGADRAGDTEPAEILLPREGHDKMSREHGIFLADGKKWIFVNYGGNGTRIRHADGAEEKLGKNESACIANADVLFFGTDDGYRLVIE